MTTVATENVKLGQQIKAQETHKLSAKLSGEQEEHRMQEAQNLLKQLQIVLLEKEGLGPEAIDDALVKAEQFLVNQSRKTTVDAETRKTLEDIAQLVGSAKNMSRHKNLVQRLQRISEETTKALEAGKLGLEVPSRATEEVQAFIDTWRPVFQLLVTSREFRELCVDALKIIRQVLLRHFENLPEYAEEKFLEGQPPKDIAKHVAKESKESFQTNEGEIRIKISDEEWDKLYDDVSRVLVTLSQHPDYRDGIERFFKLLDLWYDRLSETKETAKAKAEPHARRAQAEAEELVASFSGRAAFDNWKESLRRLVDRVGKDEAAKNYLGEMRAFILDTKNPERLNTEEFKNNSRELAQRGRQLVEEYRYGDELKDFLDSTQQLFDNIRNDEFVTLLRHHAGLVVEDLSYLDSEGKQQLDLEMIDKLRKVIVPVLAESFKYIPIPRIEYNDEKREYWVDNIVLCGYDVLPDNIHFQLESDTEVSVRDIETKKSRTRMVITLKNIRTELKNLDFYYKNKVLIDVSDRGRVTLRLSEDGATLTLIFEIYQKVGDKAPRLGEGEVHFDIHQLEILFDKTSLKHDVLVPMVTSMWKPQIQSTIEREVEKTLLNLMKPIGEQLSNALSQINRPIVSGVSKVREAIKGSEVGQVYEKRREKLE